MFFAYVFFSCVFLMCFSHVFFLCVFSRLTYSHVFFSCGVQLPCFFLCVLVSSPGEVGGGQGAFGRSPGMTRLAGSEIVENVKLRHQIAQGLELCGLELCALRA